MQDIVSLITVTLVDDCSTDGGYGEIAKTFQPLLDIDIVTLEKNGGPAVARQAGMDCTDGDFIVFLDSDDTLATSFALHQMANDMVKSGLDVVGGQFIEECENGSFVPHPQDMIWVFAKMYRRSFLDRFLIRFNDTRANEDTGFNAVVSALTNRIKHIPQTVYMWHFSENTITRSNHGEYTYAHGHRGYIENMIWAFHELERRALNREIIRNFAVTVMCRLYFMHESVKSGAPEEAEGSMAWIRKFYEACWAPIEDYIPAPYLLDIFGREQKSFAAGDAGLIMPRVTFREFLKEAKGD